MTREEAIKILSMWLFFGKDGLSKDGKRLGYIEGWFHQSDVRAFDMAIEALKQEPKTGHWIMDRQRETRQCDKCMTVYRWSFSPHNYCPNCGADMRGEV